jgi:hypothetical protein
VSACFILMIPLLAWQDCMHRGEPRTAVARYRGMVRPSQPCSTAVKVGITPGSTRGLSGVRQWGLAPGGQGVTQPQRGEGELYRFGQGVLSSVRVTWTPMLSHREPRATVGLGAVPLSRLVDPGIKSQEEGSSEVSASNMRRDEGTGHPEELAMQPTWNTLPVGWTYMMRVVLVSIALFVSACTAPGHSISNPSGIPSEGGYAGPKGSGNGDGY